MYNGREMEVKRNMARAVQGTIFKDMYVGKMQGEDGVIYCRCKGCGDDESKQAGGVTEVEL
jgi:hypothetical protein